MSTYRIGLQNLAQVIIYKKELQGQISDGMWENSKPHNHYKAASGAEPYVAETADQLGPQGWIPQRAYNFSSHQLLSIVGDRMIFAVKLYTAFPQLIPESISRDDSILGIVTMAKKYHGMVAEKGTTDEYYVNQTNRLLELLGVDSVEALGFKLLQGLDKVTYSVRDRNKDLRAIKAIFDNSRVWNAKPWSELFTA